MMQYGIKLSIKHPSETNYNFENSYLKSDIFSIKSIFYNIPIKIKIFCNQNSNDLTYFAEIWFGMFWSKLIDKNRIFSKIKILQCIQNDVVVNFNDVIRIPH